MSATERVLDEGSIAIEARLLPHVSLEQSLRSYTNAERVLKRFPEVTKVVTKIGRAEVATDPVGVDAADIFIDLKPPSEWTSAHNREELYSQMGEALERGVPEGSFSFSQPIEMRVAELIAGEEPLVLFSDYHPVPDDQYIDDPRSGARIDGTAIREAMQRVLDTGNGLFHIHHHAHRGKPGFSWMDRKETPAHRRAYH